MPCELIDLQDRIGYKFNDINILKQALSHSSYANELYSNKKASNERLEFLGDAVLELVVSESVYLENTEMFEGDMTKVRASIVCETTLAYIAREIVLGDYIFLGKGECSTGGRDRDSILSDTLEALIGAVYLDGGFASAKELINRILLNNMEERKLFFDSKTILQEIVQNDYKKKLHYKVLSEQGPDHNKQFKVVAMMDRTTLEEGAGRTKKSAEQQAAYRSIIKLQSKTVCAAKGGRGN